MDDKRKIGAFSCLTVVGICCIDKKMQSWYYRGMIEGFADLSEFHEYEEYCQLVNEVFPEE